jgi:hypothetical protein
MTTHALSTPAEAVKRCLEAVERVHGVLGPNVIYKSDAIDALTFVLGKVVAESPPIGEEKP